MKKITIIGIMLFTISGIALAQGKLLKKYPMVGDTIQDHTFTDLVNFPKKQVSILDFRGQWLLLDVWSTYCSACIASFPKMDKLSKQFKGKVNQIMVGAYIGKDRTALAKEYQKIKFIFNTQEKKHNLSFANAFDPDFHDKFKPAYPTVFVIDPQGVIVAKSLKIDSAQLASLISGNKVKLPYANSIGEPLDYTVHYDYSLPLLTTGEITQTGVADTAFIYRSVLSRWVDGMPVFYERGFIDVSFLKDADGNDSPLLKENLTGKAEALGLDLIEMLLIAYEGGISTVFSKPGDGKSNLHRLQPRVMLELKDKALFDSRDIVNGKNTYCYSLRIPDKGASLAAKLKYMKEDLHKTFGFTSAMEDREVEVLKLIVTDRDKVEKLRTVGEASWDADVETSYGKVTNTYTNWSAYELGEALTGFLTIGGPLAAQELNQFPFFDETAIDFKMTIRIKADLKNLEDVRKALQKHGLDLAKGTKSLPCIVVKDAENLPNK